MSLVGLDLNATRARAVVGVSGAPPKPLPLDDPRPTLPAALSLQGRYAEVGRAGVALCRALPHLVCDNFLSRLGTPYEWVAGRHRLDATKALTSFLEPIRTVAASAKGVVFAVPPYLDRKQGELFATAAGKAKMSYLGSVPSPIALSLSAFLSSPWSGPAIVVDVDDHALSFSVVQSTPGNVELNANEDMVPGSFSLVMAHTQSRSRLGLVAWKSRTIDGVADSCIRHSRRDPRDSGTAEQMLYDQLDDVFDTIRQEQMVEVVVQGPSWCQNLILRPEDVRAFCAPLAAHAVERLRELLVSGDAEGTQRVLVSAAAWRLPGLREALQDELFEGAGLTALDADAAAVGAHSLAVYFEGGALPREHLDAVVRCPLVQPGNSAPAKPEKKKRLFRF